LEKPTVAKSVQVDIRRKIFGSSDDGLLVIESLLFNVDSGQFVTLLGPSGCGKSTLLRLIMGLDTNFEGEIRIGDHVVHRCGHDRGIMFQEPRLIPWKTVRQNLEFAIPDGKNVNEWKSRISGLLSDVGLTDFIDSWPRDLSGGMAQRVALARAFVNPHEVLLLDEPLAAVDSMTRIKMQSELLRIMSEHRTTTIMVTHDIDEAIAVSDRVFILSRRPCRLTQIIDIDLPKPRTRGTIGFQAFQRQIYEAICESE
jgi:ABC-type nitrate/sulfonate/bicarbonate transport system ATPase subunit